MKVLWFCLSPSLSSKHLNFNHYGLGWISSLEKHIQVKVDLSIAFYSHHNEINCNSFFLNNTTYYPIPKFKYVFFSSLVRKLFNLVETEKDIDKYLKIINIVKPDIIHVHGTEGPFGLIQKHTHVPVIISLQGIASICFYKYYNGIPKSSVVYNYKIKNRLFLRSFHKTYILFKKQAIREKEILSNSKFIIGRTEWSQYLVQLLAPNAKYFHNDEILRDPFYNQSWKWHYSDKLTLTTVTSPNLYKGIEALIYCASLLDSAGFNYEWKVIGIKREDDLLHIAKRAVNKRISANIKLLGILNAQQVKDSLINSHIYLSTSHIENSSNSLCEALIMGLPCIATYSGGTSSLIENNQDGILIPDSDPFAMAGAIIKLSKNPNLAIRLGSQAQKRALLRHEPERIVNDLIDIYNSIISKID